MHLAERDIAGLRRIVAVLLALACLAERAGSRCFPVRILVLAIVSRAEWPVRAFLADTTGLVWPLDDAGIAVCGRPGEAGMIALRLRMVAAGVAALLHAECLADCCPIDRPPSPVAAPVAAAAPAARLVPVPAVTS